MPEGPETHHIADRVAQALVGKPLVRVGFALEELKPHERSLRGQCVLSANARGKALLTRFDNGITLYTHSQLLGYWAFGDARQRPPGSPRVSLETATDWAALYIAPKVELWPSDDIETHPFLAKLGPDVLDPGVTAADYVARLKQIPFFKRSLATLLLQQEFAAGMGNYLRSEVLYAARLSPYRIAATLSAQQAQQLAEALLALPRRSYRSKFKGALPASGKDYLARTAKTFRFDVFKREGSPCPSCGGDIVMERLAGRRLYHCPHCQR
jgi:endonuclease-8